MVFICIILALLDTFESYKTSRLALSKHFDPPLHVMFRSPHLEPFSHVMWTLVLSLLYFKKKPAILERVQPTRTYYFSFFVFPLDKQKWFLTEEPLWFWFRYVSGSVQLRLSSSQQRRPDLWPEMKAKGQLDDLWRKWSVPCQITSKLSFTNSKWFIIHISYHFFIREFFTFSPAISGTDRPWLAP